MQNQFCSNVHQFFSDINSLWSQLNKEASPEELVQLRAEIRTRLEKLKNTFAECLNEREVYLTLFPLVLYFDEKVFLEFNVKNQSDWPPLQKELYNTYNGGELFYSTLDDILQKSETISSIYELFYLCLKMGFKGKYGGQQNKVEEYMQRLAEKFPTTTLPPRVEKEEELELEELQQNNEHKPWLFYAGTMAILLSIYGSLYFLSSVS